MCPHLELTLNPSDRAALRALTAEEREVVIDQMLEQVREELEWKLALEAAREAPEVRQPPPLPPPPAEVPPLAATEPRPRKPRTLPPLTPRARSRMFPPVAARR